MVSLTPEELNVIALPAIITLDGDSPRTGSFALLLSIQAGEFIIMEGSTAEIKRVRTEEFLRRWSGVAAHLQKPSLFERMGTFGICEMFLGSISGVIATCIFRRLRNVKSPL